MSKVTVVSRPNRITIASKGVQGVPGPRGLQGDQGIQGPKGDTGDVTPEALAARDAAQEAASTASTAASTATGAANAASGSASAAAASANLAEQARLLGATIGFATKADMDADLDHPAGTLALVTNDPTPANNGTYRKAGSPGGGLWNQAADRVSELTQNAQSLGYLTGPESGLNLDLSSGFLRIPTSAVMRYRVGRDTATLPAQDVALPTGTGVHNVVLNLSTGALSIAAANAALPMGSAVVGRYLAATKALDGFPPHYVNGATQPPRQSWGVSTSTINNGINFDTSLMEVQIAGGSAVRVVSGSGTYALPASTVSIPAGNTFYRIEYDPRSNTVGIVSNNTAVDPFKVPFGIVQRSGSTLTPFRLDNFTVDGQVANNNPTTRGELSAQLDGAGLNFDFNSMTLTVADSTTRFTRRLTSNILPAQVVALPAASGNWSRIVVNEETRALSFKATTTALTQNEVQVGLINTLARTVYGIPSYYVNGAPMQGATLPDLTTVEPVLVNGNTDAGFELAAPLPEYDTFMATATHASIYALYDALMAAHPGYITRTSLGLDDAGNTIYRYDFRPTPVATDGLPHSSMFPKIILFAGVHGAEKAGIYTLYLALKEISDNWQDHAGLEALRWNVHFVVVPVAVPHGFDSNSRHNENGVDVARNFPSGWVARDPGHEQYGGTAPLTEKSAQYLDSIMSANRDAIYCGSFHNFFSGSDFLWNASATRFGVQLAKVWVSRQSRVWKARYSWMPQDETSYAGYASITSPPGSEGYQSTHAYGIQGGTIEINQLVPNAPIATRFSTYTATMGTEAFINWLLLNLDHGAKLYNGRL